MTNGHKNVQPTREELNQRIADLEARLEDAQETLRAIRGGEVDALVVYTDDTEHIFTLEGADYTYRVMIETITEGVANLQPDGIILYCNRRLAEMLNVSLQSLPGLPLTRFLDKQDRLLFENLISKAAVGSSSAELSLTPTRGPRLPVMLSMNRVEYRGSWSICVVVTDLTAQKRNDAIVAAERLARSILDQAAEAIVV
jgi:PAS domain S-box-containing protein